MRKESMENAEDKEDKAKYSAGKDDREKALRIMEALSGVDEYLLERSEKKAGSDKKSRTLPFWRYGKAVAACFAFLVLGACAYGSYVMMNCGSAGSVDMKSLEMAVENQTTADSAAPQAAQNNMAAGGRQSGGEKAAETGGGSDGVNVSAESAAKELEEQGIDNLAESKAEEPIKEKQDLLSEGDSVVVDMAVCPSDPRAEISLEEAMAMERIGNYVPTAIPEGYELEAARGSDPANSYKEMSLVWTKGMDDIWLHITEYYAIVKGPGSEPLDLRMADLSRPETYDVYRYEIPYAETVPEEYREVFDDPVFRASDLTLELVKTRMKSVQDQGDTDTPRGRFSVLYDSGVLVEFNGEGTPEEIWAMFQSIEP